MSAHVESELRRLEDAIGRAVDAAVAAEAPDFVAFVADHLSRSPAAEVAAQQQQQQQFAAEAVGCHALQGDKSYQEDRAVAARLGSHLYAAVFDGHVGDTAAEFCRTHVHAELATQLQQAPAAAGAALSNALKVANEAFLASDPDDASGTTACVLLLSPTNGGGAADGEPPCALLHVANIGDSRAVLFTEGSGVEQLTTDHKPDDDAEYARIEAAGGSIFDAEDGQGGRVVGPDNCSMLACARSVGDRLFKSTSPPLVPCEADVGERVVRVGSGSAAGFALVASDGVWEVLTNERACEVVRAALDSGASADAAAAALCDAALAAGSEDNISAAVLALGAAAAQA